MSEVTTTVLSQLGLDSEPVRVASHDKVAKRPLNFGETTKTITKRFHQYKNPAPVAVRSKKGIARPIRVLINEVEDCGGC